MVRCGAAKWQCRSRPVIPAFWSDLTFFADNRQTTSVHRRRKGTHFPTFEPRQNQS
jgi:hypothetical protein